MKKLLVFSIVFFSTGFLVQAQNWIFKVQLEQGFHYNYYEFDYEPENRKKVAFGRNIALVVNYKLTKYMYGGLYVTSRTSTYNFDPVFIPGPTKIYDGKIRLNRFISGMNVEFRPAKYLSLQMSGGLNFITPTILEGTSQSWRIGNTEDLSGKKLNLRTSPFARLGILLHKPLSKRIEGQIGYYVFIDGGDEIIKDTYLASETRSGIQIGINILL